MIGMEFNGWVFRFVKGSNGPVHLGKYSGSQKNTPAGQDPEVHKPSGLQVLKIARTEGSDPFCFTPILCRRLTLLGNPVVSH